MDNTGMYIERWGSEANPAVVFLHGGGVGGWMWKPQVERLGRYFRCLVPDMPGLGRSKAAGPFSHARAAEMAAELIRREVKAGKAHVVGLSEGAQAAVELLSRSPEVVDQAVVSSALVRPMPGQWMFSRGALAWSYRLAMAPFRNSDGWIRLNMKYSAGLPETYFAEFKRSFADTTEEEFVEMLYAGLHYRMPQGLERAQARTLVVCGEKEYRAMKDSVHDLAQALPNAVEARLSLGPKVRLADEHNWALTAPDLFARTLLAWFRGEPLPDGITVLQGAES